jgi:hypothetical protein
MVARGDRKAREKIKYQHQIKLSYIKTIAHNPPPSKNDGHNRGEGKKKSVNGIEILKLIIFGHEMLHGD